MVEESGLDYYGILGIDRQASIDDIQRAYRKLALKYHPFRYNGPLDRNYFYEISEAYDVLSSPKVKSLYDQYGEKAIKAGIPTPPKPEEATGGIETYTFHGDPYKVFREFFGVDNPFAELKLPNIDPEYKFCPIPEEEKTKGRTRNVPFPISIEEAFHGCKKNIRIKQKFYDKDQRKTYDAFKNYTLNIPRGCADGKTFVFKKAADQGRNIIPGDVIFIAVIYPHERFHLMGKDLVLKKAIPLAYSLTGCVVDVHTIDGKILHVPLTGVVRPGHRVKLPNEGMTTEGSDKRGNLIIEFHIKFPERISHQQKELIKAAFLCIRPDK